jgi:hypothetical protein
MAGSAKYGFYAGLIPAQTNILAGLKPPQSGGVLNPLANKKEAQKKWQRVTISSPPPGV